MIFNLCFLFLQVLHSQECRLFSAPHFLFLWRVKEKENAPLAVEKKKKAFWELVDDSAGKRTAAVARLQVLVDLICFSFRCRWYGSYRNALRLRKKCPLMRGVLEGNAFDDAGVLEGEAPPRVKYNVCARSAQHTQQNPAFWRGLLCVLCV